MAMKYEILDSEKGIKFTSIYQALNDCLGTEYTGWMKACWPNVYGNGKFRVWFPKLAETRNGKLVSAANDCVNTISSDWNEFVYDDLRNLSADMNNKYWGYDLIFAKETKGGPYIFRGVYIRDGEKSLPNHDVCKRIGTKVKIIGSPATDIEILDDFRKDEKETNINIPLSPKGIEQFGMDIKVVCGNCDFMFNKSVRCPECGQLVKY